MQRFVKLSTMCAIFAAATPFSFADDKKPVVVERRIQIDASPLRVVILGKGGVIQEVDEDAGGTITVQDGLFGRKQQVAQPHIRRVLVVAKSEQEWKAIEKKLKADGFTEKQLKQVKAAFDGAKKLSALRTEYRTRTAPSVDEAIEFTVRSAKDHRFMLGVATGPIEPELRKELGLKENEGLLVNSVLENMPAKKAGVLNNDVITAVNGKTVGKIEELVAAVQQAGKDKKSVELTIERNGKPQKISIAPIERKAVALSAGALKPANGLWKHLQIFPVQNDGSLIGPGIITRPSIGNGQIEQQLKDINKKLDQLKQDLKALGKEKRKDKSKNKKPAKNENSKD